MQSAQGTNQQERGKFKMIEFNPDGSIKLPERLAKQKQEEEYKLKKERCILIKREVISGISPKKCALHIRISEAFAGNSFIDEVYKYFNSSSQVPSKLIKINDREFDVEIGTCFSRCRDCSSLVSRFREYLDGNIIENKGSCPFESRQQFCYEDYFG